MAVGAIVDRMEQSLAHRVNAEVRAEASRQRLNQSQLAHKMDMYVSTVRRYFYSEDRDPSLGAILAACEALGVSPSELFERAERAEPTKVEHPEMTHPAIVGTVPAASFVQPRSK